MKDKGKCYLCNNEFSKRGILKHISSCKSREEVLNIDSCNKKHSYMLLKVTGRYESDYWMFLYIKSTCELKELDLFLRAVWLECCGHLSAFKIDGESYNSNTECLMDFDMNTYDMNIKIHQVLMEGMRIGYEYDFGSTTRLKIEIPLGKKVTLKQDANVILLARNSKPEVICEVCQKNNTDYISIDYSDGYNVLYLCNECLDKGNYEEETLLRYVNSPRSGVCAYEDEMETMEDIVANINMLKAIEEM